MYLVNGQAVNYCDVLCTFNSVCICIGSAAGHPGLEARLCAARMDRGDRSGEAGDVFIVAKTGLSRHGAGPAEVYRHDADRYHCNAAFRYRAEIFNVCVGHKSVLAEVSRHRGYDNSVLQDHVADLDRFQETVRHFCFFLLFLSGSEACEVTVLLINSLEKHTAARLFNVK